MTALTTAADLAEQSQHWDVAGEQPTPGGTLVSTTQGLIPRTYPKPKSDQEWANEAKEILEAYVDKANELLLKGLVVSFNMANGADGKPVSLVNLAVTKTILKHEGPVKTA